MLLLLMVQLVTLDGGGASSLRGVSSESRRMLVMLQHLGMSGALRCTANFTVLLIHPYLIKLIGS